MKLVLLKTKFLALQTFGIMLLSSSIYAQAPPNDECSAPTSITPTSVCQPLSQNLGTSTLSSESPLGSCVMNTPLMYPFGDMWYTFTAVGDSTYTISVNNFASTDTTPDNAYFNYVVYTGNCGTLTQVFCGSGNAFSLKTAPSWFQPTTYSFSNGGTPTQYYIRVVKGYAETPFISNPFTMPQPYNMTDLSFDICVYFGIPVPLDLISFEGKQEKGVNILNWKTVNEEGFDKFEIERAGADNNFYKIGEITGRNTANNNYQFEDSKPLDGKNFYRLVMKDIDATSKLSNVVLLDNAQRNSFDVSLYPNPSSKFVNLNIQGEIGNNANVIVSNLSGEILINEKVSNNNSQLNTEKLSSGIYFVKYSDDNKSKVLKFVKQ